MSTSATSFTGSSQFATQLATSIQTAITQASAPMDELETQQTTLENQQSELSTLSSDFSNLQDAIDAINSAAGSNAYTSNVSDTSVASATVSSGVMAGSYTLNVTSMGSQTNTMSPSGLTTVTDPSSGNIDSSTSYTLNVNGTSYSINNSAGTLSGLAQAINASGANVQATVVNVGSSSSPDYRLSVQSEDYAPDTIQLTDSSNTSLLSTLSSGTYVQYQVNGQPSTPINSTTQTLDLSPGLSVNVLGTGSTTVSVTQSTSNVANALSNFVTAYNTASADLAKNRGQNGGALSGDSIVYELQNALSNLTSYQTSSGTVNSLADLGVTFNSSGELQFSQATLAIASTSGAISFLGSETGGGFLQSAQNVMSSVTAANTGILTQEASSFTSQLSTIGTQITTDQANITQLQQSLTSQMSAADATISSLEQQVTEITDLFSTEQAQELSSVNG